MLGSVVADAAAFGVLGLLIGSFLNVVIHRFPKMLEAEWADNCAELAGEEPASRPAFNLMRPGSSCPHCQHQIRWYENIPVFSYLALRGKCSNCSASISIRYPAVELATACFFAFAALHHGLTPAGIAWAAFASLLIAQFFIDFDTQLLPDDLNYLILWGGLIASLIDCHCVGTAAAAMYRAEGREIGSLPAFGFVTGSLHVDYLKPTPLAGLLELRGRVKEIKGRKVIVEASVLAGSVVTARGEVVAVQIPPGFGKA